jgi:hypothetical protein
MRTSRRKFIGFFTLLLITLMFSISVAEVPGVVVLEGSLADLGLPIDERVEMMFSLYDSETADTAFWSQKQMIEARNGRYSIVLKSFPKNVFRDARYYLGVEVRTEKAYICLGRKRLDAVVEL